jgi:RF-1 domain
MPTDDEPAGLVAAALRDRWILAPDAALLAECAVDRYRASGPGGQHRNKTESAIRLRHRPSGVSAIAEDSRSQAENRVRALRRLREHVALGVRSPAGEGPSPRLAAVIAGGTAPLGERTRVTPGYLAAMAELLDHLAAAAAEVAAAARRLGMTTGALSKLLTHDPRVARAANQLRGARGLRPLR